MGGETKAERHARGFACWTQFVAMLFCHLADADSLRLICNGLSCCPGQAGSTWALPNLRAKSSLGYANRHRPAALFQQLFWKTLARFRSQSMFGASAKPFRFKNKLLSPSDSTTISLCLSLFPCGAVQESQGLH